MMRTFDSDNVLFVCVTIVVVSIVAALTTCVVSSDMHTECPAVEGTTE